MSVWNLYTDKQLLKMIVEPGTQANTHNEVLAFIEERNSTGILLGEHMRYLVMSEERAVAVFMFEDAAEEYLSYLEENGEHTVLDIKEIDVEDIHEYM